MIKRLLVAIAIVFVLTQSALADRNGDVFPVIVDTVRPDTSKVYLIKMTPKQYQLIDSVLQVCQYQIGRTLTVDQADPLKNGLWEILVFFARQTAEQDKKKSSTK